ncbi:hypothetical protein CSW23_05005 [Thermus scotoductus]|uniref:Uncharacterized protein n=1 Tax=Thermus scotoductus TaxID=37636 RepID=A0A430V4Q4_THESC|nr:hypothetical protein CSW31_02640 [Thermus scotoductus]RTI18309.1 hypothetical protein CSW23_05005 [Thermus scotoductus]
MMRWGILVLTSLVLGVAWGQTCTVRYTAPNYPELPVGRPQIYLTVSPTALASPGSFTVRAWTSSPSTTAWVRIRWTRSELALGNVEPWNPIYTLLSPNPVQGCPEVQVSTRSLSFRDNGFHNFTAEAFVYWKEWREDWSCKYRDSQGEEQTTTVTTSGGAPGSPYYACTLLRGYWVPLSGTVSTSSRGAAYLTWERELSYDQALQEFAHRLVEDHKRAGASMLAYAYAKEIPEPVRGALAQVARGYFYDCGFLGICQRADPAGEVKVLTDVPSILYGLLYTGRLCGGFITFCFGQQNARGADIGPKVEIKTFLMVKGFRHDYLLMDRVIPRKYYDPSDPEYPAVPQDERSQVLQGCLTYKDTPEGRRCLALAETPTGLVPTLKTLLMIDPMFQRGRQYP